MYLPNRFCEFFDSFPFSSLGDRKHATNVIFCQTLAARETSSNRSYLYLDKILELQKPPVR